MRTLVACPFCREMFSPEETKTCPECGLQLKRLDELGAPQVLGDELEEIPPDEEILPWTYHARGRGALVVVGLLGIVAFFLPWAEATAPERAVLSGVDFASRLGWMWAPLVAWMVLLPLTISRRSIYRLRGARVATAFLAAMAALTVVVRVAFPPTGSALDPVRLEWAYGLWLSGVLGVLGIVISLRLGGPIDDLHTQKQKRPDGETLH